MSLSPPPPLPPPPLQTSPHSPAGKTGQPPPSRACTGPAAPQTCLSRTGGQPTCCLSRSASPPPPAAASPLPLRGHPGCRGGAAARTWSRTTLRTFCSSSCKVSVYATGGAGVRNYAAVAARCWWAWAGEGVVAWDTPLCSSGPLSCGQPRGCSTGALSGQWHIRKNPQWQ